MTSLSPADSRSIPAIPIPSITPLRYKYAFIWDPPTVANGDQTQMDHVTSFEPEKFLGPKQFSVPKIKAIYQVLHIGPTTRTLATYIKLGKDVICERSTQI